VGYPKVRDNLEELNVNGRIILTWILRNNILRIWSGFGPVADSCEHDNETSRIIS
jgi:hypothetical protein